MFEGLASKVLAPDPLEAEAGPGWRRRLTDRLGTDPGQLLQRQGPQIAVVVLGFAIAAYCACIVRGLIAADAEAAPNMASHGALDPAPQADLAAVGRLFGVPAASTDTSAAVETTMAVLLLGTLATPDPQRGWAIVGESSQASRVYAAGSILQGERLLKAVYRDYIVLEHGGELETLRLKRAATAEGAALVTTAIPQVETLETAVADAAALPASMLEDMVQGKWAATEVIKPRVRIEQGQIRSVRLYPGSDLTQFRKLGLKAGDELTEVDGEALAEPDQIARVLSTLPNRPGAVVTVVRFGKTVKIVLDAPGAPATVDAAQSG